MIKMYGLERETLHFQICLQFCLHLYNAKIITNHKNNYRRTNMFSEKLRHIYIKFKK